MVWGKSIRAQRLRQRITGDDSCARLGIFRATLRRLGQEWRQLLHARLTHDIAILKNVAALRPG